MKAIIKISATIAATFSLFLNHASAQPTPSNTCDDDYHMDANNAQIELNRCLEEVQSNYDSCMVFPFSLIVEHRQACQLDRTNGENSCRDVYDARVDAAEGKRSNCNMQSNNDDHHVLVIYDPWDNQGILGELNIADGEQFNDGANEIALENEHTVLVSTTASDNNRIDLDDIRDAADRVGHPIDEVYIIDHGGDVNGDGLVDQTIGDNLNILDVDGKLIDDLCEVIDDITNPGAKIYLCGCSVGKNKELCSYISKHTQCTVYADDENVMYSDRDPINTTKMHVVCEYRP